MSADAYSLFTDRVGPGVDLRFVSSLPLEGPLKPRLQLSLPLKDAPDMAPDRAELSRPGSSVAAVSHKEYAVVLF